MRGSPARRAAEAYVESVNAGDVDGLVELFADDAVLFHPLGLFQGREALRQFYGENVLAFAPTVTASQWVADGPDCVFELEANVEGGSSHAIDHLTVDGDGRIVRMAIGYR